MVGIGWPNPRCRCGTELGDLRRPRVGGSRQQAVCAAQGLTKEQLGDEGVTGWLWRSPPALSARSRSRPCRRRNLRARADAPWAYSANSICHSSAPGF